MTVHRGLPRDTLADARRCLDAVLDGMRSDVLLIVAPFGGVERPALGVHQLAACAEQHGHQVDILYANLLFCRLIGERRYLLIETTPYHLLVGERLFAPAAHELPGVELLIEQLEQLAGDYASPARMQQLREHLDDLAAIQAVTRDFVALTADAIASRRLVSRPGDRAEFSSRPGGQAELAIIGLTTTFQQINASHALLRAIRERQPELVTLLGGCNCGDDMAAGQLELGRGTVDYVFSGESEASFPEFLSAARRGELPRDPIIRGQPCEDMNSLPPVRYDSWYEQLDAFVPGPKQHPLTALYESSRGCWWGEKHHCTFCGLGEMRFREKHPQRVLAELRALLDRHPNGRVMMTDLILPSSYFKTLLPELGDALPEAELFYEVKANLTYERCRTLQRANIRMIQPGIEALSTSLLARMDKGVTARQNLQLLRYALVLGLDVTWNLLYGFPGDTLEEYAEQLALIPLITHLQPPAGPFRLSLDRSSPYFEHPERYGIRAMRPMPAYEGLFPAGIDVEGLAYHFVGDYDSASISQPPVVRELAAAVASWSAEWRRAEPPVLEIRSLDDGRFELCDTRGAVERHATIELDLARVELLLGRAQRGNPEAEAWALDTRLAVELDGRFVSLVTAAQPLFERFHREPEVTRLAVL